MKLYWGWVVCLCFLLLFTVCAGIAFSFSEVMIPLNKEMHKSLALLDWIGALPGSLAMILAPIGTYVNFKLGTRLTVYAGVLIASFFLALTAIVQNVTLLFLCFGIMLGVGLVLIVNPPFFLLDEYFPYNHHRHVLATSIIACGFPLATLIFNPVTYVLLANVQWRVTYSIYAVLLFVVGSLTTWTFRHKYNKEVDPVVEEMRTRGEVPLDDMPPDVTLAKRTKIICGTLWFIVSTLKSMGYYTPYMTLVKQMDVMGIPPNQSSKAMAVVGACEMFSRLITSYVGDSFKGKILYLYVFNCLALCIQNALGTLASTFTHLVIYAAALGLFGGPVIAAMYSSCSEVMQGQHVPVLFTVFRVGLGLGGIMGPTLAGFIFDQTDSFLGVFYMNSATYFATSMLYAFIMYINKYKPKWCYPENNEELSLVNNLKGPDTTNTKAFNSLQTDNPLFTGITSDNRDDTDSSDTDYERRNEH